MKRFIFRNIPECVCRYATFAGRCAGVTLQCRLEFPSPVPFRRGSGHRQSEAKQFHDVLQINRPAPLAVRSMRARYRRTQYSQFSLAELRSPDNVALSAALRSTDSEPPDKGKFSYWR